MSIDVAFAIDSSGSLGLNNFIKEVDFVKNVVKSLNLYVNSQVAVELFNYYATIQFHLNDHESTQDVLDGLASLYYGGTTNTADAIKKMRTEIFTAANGDRDGVQNIGVIITDGVSDNHIATVEEAKLARAQGIILLAVGAGSVVNPQELEAIASYPSQGNVFRVEDVDSLDSIERDIVRTLCNGQ